ncbi:MAG: nucleotidyltransferase domain-containing protein [Xanthobacteraceae bacterium]
MIEFQELNGDQRREVVNTQQRYSSLRESQEKAKAYRGSMVWTQIKGRDYLIRSYYDRSGLRRQTSLGPRAKETEAIKREFDRGRETTRARLADLQAVMTRQTAINRAIGLGRVPLIGAKIIRALDRAGMLGSGIRVLGTNAVYAYEAAAGVRIDPDLTSTEDIDLLIDARRGLIFEASEDVSHPSLLHLLRRIDRSFERAKQAFRAVNSAGYLVDLIKPLRDPPWADANERARIGADADDLTAVEIEGLAWHESAPSFEAVAIDEKGEPCRIIATDPRVWAAHKLWLSKRPDREAFRRRRDEAQARTIGRLVADYLPHLPYAAQQLRMLPKSVFEKAAPLFSRGNADEGPARF